MCGYLVALKPIGTMRRGRWHPEVVPWEATGAGVDPPPLPVAQGHGSDSQ
jgi:hypothetical protein